MKTEIEELKNFVMEIDEIEKISKSIDSFNLFETLGLVHHEIRHSNVLTWLLDPFQTHNLSYLFLQKFLKDLIMFNLNSTDQINDQLIFDFETLNYEDVDVKREYKNIDILILIKKKIKNTVLSLKIKFIPPNRKINYINIKLLRKQSSLIIRKFLFSYPPINRFPPRITGYCMGMNEF